MERKKLHISKRYNSAFFKYSNQELFERREKQFLKDKKGNKYKKHIYHNSSRNNYRNLKQQFFKEKNIFEYLKTLEILNSNDKDKKINNKYCQTISYYNEIDRKINKKIKNKLKSTKKETILNYNNLFNLTETNNFKQKKRLYNNNSTKNNLTANYRIKFDIKNDYEVGKKKLFLNNDYNYKGVKELLLIKKEKELKYSKDNQDKEKNDEIKDLKISHINRLKKDSGDYIEKINKYKTIRYSCKNKRERLIRLEEIYKNQNEFYKYTYDSLLNSKRTFNEFTIKTSEYLKFLSIKINKENLENKKIMDKVINLKNDIENINSKIKKVEILKSNIIKWLYFQIKLKEKKLILPDYYKAVLEYSNNKNKYVNIRKKTESKNLAKSSDIKNKGLNDHIINDKFEINGRKISIEEFQKIREYKNKIIYPTPEIFNEALLSLENNNLKLISHQNTLRKIIYFLKNELNKVENENNITENYINNRINNNKNEINQLKSSISGKINIITNSGFETFLDVRKNKRNSVLFIKVSKIYKHLKKLEKGNNEKDENKKQITLEKGIINMLKFIEIKTDELINKVNSYYKKDENESMRSLILRIKFEIDKHHKREKSELQRNKLKEKYRKLYQEIEARSNKIYLFPKKKLDISRIKAKKKIIQKIKTENKEISNFEDYLY